MASGSVQGARTFKGSTMPAPPLRRWLSQQEAAEYLGVSDRTIRNYIRSGVLTGRRLPGSRLIRLDRTEVDDALRPVPSTKGGSIDA